MSEQVLYDVIVVGAGPAGSSAAAWLARQGASVLLLDKAVFPRDKVCGDGLMPQAIYWLDVLGCAEEVLAQAHACVTSADMYVNGEHILTGGFRQDGPYPGFFTLLERRKLDATLARYAASQGAGFRPGHRVVALARAPDSIAVEVEHGGSTSRYAGRLLIGADGGNSVVARALGNAPHTGTTAVSLRAYYRGVKVDRSQFKVYFNREFFPGYGWVFADDTGKANIGVGAACDPKFPVKHDLKAILAHFVETDLKDFLRDAAPLGPPAGWWECFYRQGKVVDDRVMLVGDAANAADPMNGGGIAKALESGYRASQVALQALARGDCTRASLAEYERLWHEQVELDWRIGELFLTFAKNPDIRELSLFLLKTLGRLSERDARFGDYCINFFGELTPRSLALSPFMLLDVVPVDPRTWLGVTGASSGGGLGAPAAFGVSALQAGAITAGRMVTSPLGNIDWGLELLQKALDSAACYADREWRVPAGGNAGAVPR